MFIQSGKERWFMVARPKAKEPRGEPIHIRFTATERTQIEEQAAGAGLSLSEFCRRAALGRVVVSRMDLTIANELRKLGGLMKHIHNETHGVYSKETASVLVAIEKALAEMRRDA